MKITKEQYQKAKDSLPKLRKVEELVKTWEKAVEGETGDVTSITISDEGIQVTHRKAEVPRVARTG